MQLIPRAEMHAMRKFFCVLAIILLSLLICPYAYSQEQEVEADTVSPVFSYYIAIFGPDIDVGFGFSFNGHELLLTPYISLVAPESPFLFPFAMGARWGYQDWQLWARYVHWIDLPGIFIRSDFGQGIDLQTHWILNEEDNPVTLNNYLFIGNGRFNHVSSTETYFTLYNTLTLLLALYQSSPYVAHHRINAQLSAHIVSLPDSDSTVYAFEVSFPMNFWSSVLLVTPRIKYAQHSLDSLLNIDNAVGYSFDSISSFSSGTLYNIPFGSSSDHDGNLQLSLSIEGRWYFLEQLYLPLLSGLYFAAFTDIAYGLDSRENLSSGVPNLAVGGGAGFKWTGLNFKILAGYEHQIGFRLNIALIGEL